MGKEAHEPHLSILRLGIISLHLGGMHGTTVLEIPGFQLRQDTGGNIKEEIEDVVELFLKSQNAQILEGGE